MGRKHPVGNRPCQFCFLQATVNLICPFQTATVYVPLATRTFSCSRGGDWNWTQ